MNFKKWKVEEKQMDFLPEDPPILKIKNFMNLKHFIIFTGMLKFPIKEKYIYKYLSFSPKVW